MTSSMKKSLTFKDEELEKEFKLSRLGFHKSNFKIVTLSSLIYTTGVYISNTLEYNIFEVYTLVPFFLWGFITVIICSVVCRKKPQHSSTGIIISVLLNIALLTEYISYIIKREQIIYRWTYLYYGMNVQIMYLSLYLSDISWSRSICVSIVGQIHTWIRLQDDNFTARGLNYSLILFATEISFLLLLSYSKERNARLSFLNLHENKIQLKTFEDLIKKVIPSSILIMKKEELIFFNDRTIKILGSSSETQINDILRSLKIIKKYQPDTNFMFSGTYIPEIRSDNHYQFSLLELINDWEFALKWDVNYCIEGFYNLEGEVCGQQEDLGKSFSIQIGPINWKGKKSVIIILNDITPIKKHYKSLDLYKNNLLATVSHDLRTPLNGIMGMIDLVMEEAKDEQTKEKLLVASLSGKLLLSMINDLLDFSLISKGRLRLVCELTNVTNLVEETIKLLSLQACMKGIKICFENELPSISEEYMIDGNRLRQVLVNLLGNAIKYTNSGKIWVRVKEERANNEEFQENSYNEVARSQDSRKKMYSIDYIKEYPLPSSSSIDSSIKRRLFFEVEDTGIGIKQKDLAKLFRLVSRTSAEEGQDQNGIGLGLAISQSLVNLMNSFRPKGEIRVKSDLGKGSKFFFPIFLDDDPSEYFKEKGKSTCFFPRYLEPKRLDLYHYDRLATNSPLVTEQENLITEVRMKIRVLVIDDDQINLMVANNYLKSMELDFIIETAINGLEALEKVRNLSEIHEFYDIFLMDCNMPIMDGYQASKILKQMMKSAIITSAPIVAITANIGNADKEKCFASGMDHFLTKPYKKSQLEKVIQDAIRIDLKRDEIL